MRLRDVSYAADGTMTYERHDTTAPVSVLADYTAEARRIMSAATPCASAEPAHLTADFDALRWFELPAESLDPQPMSTTRDSSSVVGASATPSRSSTDKS